MNTNFKIALALVVGAALGTAATQGLHAQAKPKAYIVNETEVLDAAAQAEYTRLVRPAITAAGGRNFNTSGGKTVTFVGAPPQRVAITEWDSFEQAQAWRNSAAFKNLAAQRDKAQKQIRAYAVEALPN